MIDPVELLEVARRVYLIVVDRGCVRSYKELPPTKVPALVGSEMHQNLQGVSCQGLSGRPALLFFSEITLPNYQNNHLGENLKMESWNTRSRGVERDNIGLAMCIFLLKRNSPVSSRPYLPFTSFFPFSSPFSLGSSGPVP
jgi:hypothetical protein